MSARLTPTREAEIDALLDGGIYVSVVAMAAYDLRKEVRATRAELAEAKATISDLEADVDTARCLQAEALHLRAEADMRLAKLLDATREAHGRCACDLCCRLNPIFAEPVSR